jgi:hypothetical protein
MKIASSQKIRTARSPPKLSLKPSRLEGRVYWKESTQNVFQDCCETVNIR